MPDWLKGDVLDVRKTVNYYLTLQEVGASAVAARQQQYVAFPRVSVSKSSSVISVSIKLCATTSQHLVYKAIIQLSKSAQLIGTSADSCRVCEAISQAVCYIIFTAQINSLCMYWQ